MSDAPRRGTVVLVTDELRQCAGCGRWSHGLTAPGGLCLFCQQGWVHCAEHGRLEWARAGEHQRVSVKEVLLAVPDFAKLGEGGSG